jgi:hypothetical protein
LPLNSSDPPTAIEILVEREFAFRSTLVEAAGAPSDVPSPKVVPGVPKVTASTTVPVAMGPSTKAMLLLLAIVPLVLASQLMELLRLVLHQRKYPWAGTAAVEAKVTRVALVVPLVFLPSLIPLRLTSEAVGL